MNEANGMDSQGLRKISKWNLPESVENVYRENGVTEMFDWQAECLTLKGVLTGKNLVFAAPTSAGKTFVAEILMLKRALETNLKVLFILPFISVAREKLFHLQNLFSEAGLRVDGYMGGYAPSSGIGGWDIAVCTIEKANGVINRMIVDGKLNTIGLIVVDELHMVGDKSRGYILELLLTKVQYLSTQNDNDINIQIVGMSATLPNLDVVSTWLNAVLYKTEFRPVPLKRCLKINDSILDEHLNEIQKFSAKYKFKDDDEDVISLCYETVSNGHSVLIFCPTKKWCENLAMSIAHQFYDLNKEFQQKKTDSNVPIDVEGVKELLIQLNRSPSQVDPILFKTTPLCVAFHHAGLTMEERDIIERGFRNGVIRVLVATSTLSSGVNLPARRVIIRSPIFNRSLLDVRTYRQMTGRAGRKGVDDKGESILICKRHETAKAKELITSTELPVRSCLIDNDDLSMCMKRAILEIVVNGIANTKENILDYTKCTLLSAEMQRCSDTESQLNNDLIATCVSWLVENEFLFTSNENETISSTQLGRAALLSSLPISDALTVLTDLNAALKCLALDIDLHLAYLVTPIFCYNDWVGLDWYAYLNTYEAFPSPVKNVAKLIGIQEQFLMQMASSNGHIPTYKNVRKAEKIKQMLRIHRRFYAALALHDLIREIPLWEVSRKYSCNKGMLQQLQQSASSFAGMVTVFCQELGWWSLEVLLKEFQARLAFGVQRELVDLMQISLLNGQRARAIYNAGFTSCVLLSEATCSDVVAVLKNAYEFQTTKQGFNENEWEVKERQKLRTIHVTGQNGLTEESAAEFILKEARFIAKMGDVNTSMLPQQSLLKTQQTKTNISISKDQTPVTPPAVKPVETNLQPHSLKTNTNLSDISILSEKDCSNIPSGQGNTSNISLEVSAALVQSGGNVHQSDTSMNLFESEQLNINSLNENMNSLTLDDKPDVDANTLITESQANKIQWDDFDEELSANLIAEMDDTFDDDNPKLPANNESTPCERQPLKSIRNSQNSRISDIFDFSGNQSMSESSTHTPDKFQEKSILLSFEGNKSFSSDKSSLVLFNDSRDKSNEDFKFSFEASPSQETQAMCRTSLLQSQLSNTPLDSLNIIDVGSSEELFAAFVSEWKEKNSFSIAITQSNSHEQHLAICWGNRDVYYLYLYNDEISRVPYKTKLHECKSALNANLKNSSIIGFNLKEISKIIFHMLKLDLQGTWYDPSIAAWMLDPDANSDKNTIELVREYLTMDPNLARILKKFCKPECKSKKLDCCVPLNIKCCLDCLLSYKLMKKMKVDLQSVKMWDYFVDVEMPHLKLLANMELNGMPINSQKLKALKSKLHTTMKLLDKRAHTFSNNPFRLSSPQEIAKVLFHELGLPPGGKVEGGKPGDIKKISEARNPKSWRMNTNKINMKSWSTNKVVLTRLTKFHELPALINDWRMLSYTFTNYVIPMTNSCDNRVVHHHCLVKTLTGRITMAEPNIQNIPKEFKTNLEGKTQTFMPRDVFTAPTGTVFLSVDFSQLELRIFAHFSQDEQLINILNNLEIDAFCAIAAKWKNSDMNSVTDEARQQTKQICYGMLYGIGMSALAEQLNKIENEAEEFMKTFMDSYPGIKKCMSKIKTDCIKNGYISTILNRRRYLPDINSPNLSTRSKAERQAINSTIQGSAADIVKMATVKLMYDLKPFDSKHKFVMHLHDEIILQVDGEVLKDVAKLVVYNFENALKLDVKLPVKIKVGRSWGKLDIYKLN